MPPLGAHMSIAGGFYKAVEAAARCEMDCVQIFTGSPQIWAVTAVGEKAKAGASAEKKSTGSKTPGDSAKTATTWRGKPIDAADAVKFDEALRRSSIGHPIAHDSYLINLAAPDDALWRRSIEAFIVELQRAEQLGIPYVVTHPGAHTSSTEADGLRRIVCALDEVHRRTADLRAICLLENTAGQGTCLGHRFEHLGEIIAGVKQPERLGVCIDTCHAFAAGYPLVTATEYDDTMGQLDQTVGLDRIKAFHLNDSKKPLGSRVDRHEHIGEGALGLEPFRHLMNDPRFRQTPMYLETPKGIRDGEELDVINLRTLRSLTAPAKK